jgi:hypothetical protein
VLEQRWPEVSLNFSNFISAAHVRLKIIVHIISNI